MFTLRESATASHASHDPCISGSLTLFPGVFILPIYYICFSDIALFPADQSHYLLDLGPSIGSFLLNPVLPDYSRLRPIADAFRYILLSFVPAALDQ